MDWLDAVRVAARTLRENVLAAVDPPVTTLQLVEAAIQYLDLELYLLRPDDPQLRGARAVFDIQSRTICCGDAPVLADRIALISHELGHALLDTEAASCAGDDLDPSQPSELSPIGLQRVEDYGQRERRELRANVFAREFLLPRAEARRLYLEESLSTANIATRLELQVALVRQQLLDALLLPSGSEPEHSEPIAHVADASQTRASAHRGAPFLLQAGPGTGKTRALVDRVSGLLVEGVDPAAIVVLTFSNRAAGELCERLSRAHSIDSARIWVGTFHAFGLDLVRRYHDRLGLPSNPSLVDRSDAIAMLEEVLPTLGLKHYRDLWNPARQLRDMLVAISRAKDELVDPVGYRHLAQCMLDDATTGEERETAEKALEVSHVYEEYQRRVHGAGAVDFGDLIMAPTALLERDEPIRNAVALRHRHVLVDEYQDVNRASARLLASFVGDGRRLWVVGDSRQSIYRFRGASAANMTRFHNDYPGAESDQLSVNYRSSSELVTALVSIAPRMLASESLLPLEFDSCRGGAGISPRVVRVERPVDELNALVDSISELVANGVPLREQAVLCRSNTRVADVADALEARNIPVLHLGSVFEREEIRDLLALLTLLSEHRGSGLLRVGKLARYGLSAEDTQEVVGALRGERAAAGPRLRKAADTLKLSSSGKEGLRRLADDLEGFTAGSSPWEVLTTFILDRARLAAELATGSTVVGKMRAIAVWQFLNFVRQPVPGAGPRIRRLLARVRMMVLLAEERDLRRVPSAALHLDAVRIMTVHAAKGLEFEAVHVPGMTVAGFPASRQGDPCPPPATLVDGGLDAARGHEEEEQCLFFVAVSRARTHLYLYAAGKQANGKNRNPSPFLDWMRSTSVETRVSATVGGVAVAVETVPVEWSDGFRIEQHAFKSYEQCPRRFLYTHVLALGTARSPSAYGQTKNCLYELIRWAAKERAIRPLTAAEMLERFAEIWEKDGPTSHPYAADYRNIGERLVRSLAHSGEALTFQEPRMFELEFSSGSVVVRPDELATSSDGILVLRLVRPGYRRVAEDADVRYGLLDLAGAQARDGAYRVEAVHLTDNERQTIPVSGRRRANNLARAQAASADIRAGRFPRKTSSYYCPQCPHFFVCPSVPAGTLASQGEKGSD